MRGAYQPEFGQMPAGDTSFGGVFAALNRRKWWILMATTVAFVASAAFVNVVTPKYTGEAKVLLENRDNYFTRPDRESRGTEPSIDAEAVQSQVQLIMSRDIARTVIKKLNLAAQDEFDSGRREASPLKKILALAGLAKDPLATSPDDRVLEAYMDKLLVYNVGKSRVISVEFSSRDPELAATAANLVADEYIRFQGDAKKSTTQGASAWLLQTIDALRAKVAEAENKVEAFRSSHGLLVGSANATIVTQQLGEMSTQISNARSTQSDLQTKARLIREALKNGRIFETSEVVNNELVRRLLEQRVAMKTQIALEERTLLPGHPRMKELTAQIADLESQIRTAAERTARTMENDARVAGARVQSLQSDFEGQKRTAADANGSEVQLRALEREARALRENYESYLSKYRDALSRNSDAAAPADARVISRAVAPQKPTFPKKLPVILLATLATLVLSCAIIITRQVFSTDQGGEMLPPAMVDAHGRFVGPDMADYAQPYHPAQPQPAPHPEPPRAATPEPPQPAAPEVRTPPRQPVAPAMPAAPPQPVAQSIAPDEAAARLQAAFRPVRKPPAAQVAPSAPPVAAAPQPAPPPPLQSADPLAGLADDLAALKAQGQALVVGCHAYGHDVASAQTALPLARMLSQGGATVYVDLAGARQATEQAVGHFMAAGITDILAGAASFGECIHRDRASRLHVIPAGDSGFDPTESLAGESFAAIVEALSLTYDFVVLDAGPLGTMLDDAMGQSGAIILVSSRDDSDPAVARVFQRLDAVRPGCVTIVVDEPVVPPQAANDRTFQRHSAA